MIVLDIEATGLMQALVTPLIVQPHTVELTAVKLDQRTFRSVGRLEFLCKPPVPLPVEFTRITGIRQIDVHGCKPFSTYYPELCKFFLGESTLIAHNATYDIGVLSCELRRLGKECAFPWPYHAVCTIETTAPYLGRYLELRELYQTVLNRQMPSAHRSGVDTDALVEIVQALSKQQLFDQLVKRRPVAYQR